MPDSCPVCSAEVVKEGAYTFCPAGLSCPSQLVGHIIHFASRDALNIEGLGEKTAKDLVRKGMVNDMADLYQLSVDDILKLDGFAQKSATQLYEAIQSKKNPRLDRFLYALGIRHVGQRVARVLTQEYVTLEKLRKASRSELEEIAEIAREHDIPVVENVPLARALYAVVEIDDEIPAEHFHAVAEIIGYVMGLKRGFSGHRI